MDREYTPMQDYSSSPDMADMVKDTLEDFNKAIRSLAETRKSLEQDVTTLRGETDMLKKDKAVLEADTAKTQEVSEIAMAAKAAEEEKQDALKRNQELKSYLDSAAGTIKALKMKLTGAESEIKRLRSRMGSLEGEKLSLVKEKENIQAKMFRMNNMISEQDLKTKELAIKLETTEDDRRFIESELKASRQALNEIQKSTISLKDKVRKGYLEQPQAT